MAVVSFKREHVRTGKPTSSKATTTGFLIVINLDALSA